MAFDRHHLTNNRFLQDHGRRIADTTHKAGTVVPTTGLNAGATLSQGEKKQAPLSTQEEMSLQIDLCITNLASGL